MKRQGYEVSLGDHGSGQWLARSARGDVLTYGYRNREVRNADARSHVLREIVQDQAEVVRQILREIAATPSPRLPSD